MELAAETATKQIAVTQLLQLVIRMANPFSSDVVAPVITNQVITNPVITNPTG